MFFNVTFAMLAFNFIVSHLNPESPILLIRGSTEDQETMKNIITRQSVVVTRLNDYQDLLDDQLRNPSCVLLMEEEEWEIYNRKPDCFCRVILAPFELNLENQISNHSCYGTTQVSSSDRTTVVRLSLPLVYPPNRRQTSHWSPRNISELATVLKRSKTNCNGAQMIASIFPKRFSAVQEKDGNFSGIDGEMLKLITFALNLTLRIHYANQTIKYGSKLPNGSFDGILGDIYSGKADFASNRLFIKEYGSDDFTFTMPIEQEALCIVVPMPNLVPSWKMVLRAFSFKVWLGIGISILSYVFTWHLLNNWEGSRPDVSGSIIYIIGMCVSVVVMPKKPWQRMFTLSVLMSFGVLTPAFTGSMLSLLKTRSYEKRIKTLAQVKDSDYNIFTYSTNLIEDSLPDYLQGRLRLFKSADTGEDLIEIVGAYRNLSYLGKECETHRRMKETRSQVQIVNECTRVYHLAYVMRRGASLYRSTNTAVARILAAGLNQSPRCMLECTKTAFEDDHFVPMALGIKDLTITLNIFKFGLSTAVATFLMELLVGFMISFYRRNRNKRRS